MDGDEGRNYAIFHLYSYTSLSVVTKMQWNRHDKTAKQRWAIN